MAARTKPVPEVHLTWDQALSWRVGRQLLSRPLDDPLDVVSELGGVQAQLASSALQATAIRSTSLPDVGSLLWERRELVKTWAMRGTLHLLTPSSYRDWVTVMSDNPPRITPGWEKYHGVTAAQLESVTEAIAGVVGPDPMTREELTAAVVDATGDTVVGAAMQSGWGQVLKPAANRGYLVQGPPRGRNVTFVSPSAWLGGTDAPSLEQATLSLTLRFFTAHEPATSDDFGRWLGRAHATARRFMSVAMEDLIPVSVEGGLAWMTAEGAEGAAGSSPVPGSYLLPGFDPWTLAPLSHRAVTIPEGRVPEVSRTAGWIAPVIVVDGRVAGTWAAEGGVVSLSPFDRPAKGLVDAVEGHIASRYHGLLGEKPVIGFADSDG